MALVILRGVADNTARSRVFWTGSEWTFSVSYAAKFAAEHYALKSLAFASVSSGHVCSADAEHSYLVKDVTTVDMGGYYGC